MPLKKKLSVFVGLLLAVSLNTSYIFAQDTHSHETSPTTEQHSADHGNSGAHVEHKGAEPAGFKHIAVRNKVVFVDQVANVVQKMRFAHQGPLPLQCAIENEQQAETDYRHGQHCPHERSVLKARRECAAVLGHASMLPSV